MTRPNPYFGDVVEFHDNVRDEVGSVRSRLILLQEQIRTTIEDVKLADEIANDKDWIIEILQITMNLAITTAAALEVNVREELNGNTYAEVQADEPMTDEEWKPFAEATDIEPEATLSVPDDDLV